MNLAKKLLMTTGTSSGTVPTPSGGYVDDVFSTYLYTGNGSTQTINNGIDLAGEGGLVWQKLRSGSPGGGALNSNLLWDTIRGVSSGYLKTDTTQGAAGAFWLTSFNSNGFSFTDPYATAGANYVSWTFRKAPKFFDVVTYTGNGAAGRQIAHSLGVQAGFITVKSTSTTGDWNSYHRSATGDLKLNTTDAQTASRTIITAADASTFTVSGAANTNGQTYVAYLFAHDPSADGIIQCGSFTADSSSYATVTLGWEPQYILYKRADSASDWRIFDTTRSWSSPDSDGTANLWANLASAEILTRWVAHPTATGMVGYFGEESATYIYMTIRRSNKPPTSGTQVYNAIARTGTGAAATVTGVGFAPDYLFSTARNASASGNYISTRLQGAQRYLLSNDTGTEVTWAATVTSFNIDGVSLGSGNGFNGSSQPLINHFFRRAAGFFDVVCDTGTGTDHAIAHNLTKAPELIIRKSRSAATQWEVWHSALAATEKLVLNSNAAKAADTTAWNSTLPTATQFTVGTGTNVNANTATFVTYLFATLAGISKVGSYNGNGGTQTIPCGFTTGSRFVLIKRVDNTGDWFVWDTARGITPTTDPHLSLNTVAAEVTTDDSIDQDTSGFIVNQNAATNINALGGNYLFLAIA